MRRSLLITLPLLALASPRPSRADADLAVKALVPGLGQFEAGQTYRGLAYAGSQIAFLFLGFEALGNREAAVVASRHALIGTDTSKFGEEAYFDNKRIGDYNHIVKYSTYKAAAYFTGFAAVYAASIFDAYRTPTRKDEDAGSLSLGVGLTPDAGPALVLTKNF